MTMSREEIGERVCRILREELNPELEPHPNHKLADDLGADRLDKVALVMMFEDDFGIEIADGEGDDLKTVEDCVDLVERKRSAG